MEKILKNLTNASTQKKLMPPPPPMVSSRTKELEVPALLERIKIVLVRIPFGQKKDTKILDSCPIHDECQAKEPQKQ